MIWVYRYELVSHEALNARSERRIHEGALIRAGNGVADIHPWPELGDAPLGTQLDLLARGELTRLTRRSLALAASDAEARDAGKSLFDGLTVPDSHYSYVGGSVPDGFTTVKVKMPRDLEPVRGYKLRLDYNAMHDEASFERECSSLPDGLDIDFVEDPCEYNAAVWRRLRQRLGCRLALDRQIAIDGVDVLIVKPAIQEIPAAHGREMVITSYMDHPVGQLGAAWVAARHRTQVGLCGLMTHLVYEPNEFSEQLSRDGARLVPPSGTGIGFDDLLERLPWKRLS